MYTWYTHLAYCSNESRRGSLILSVWCISCYISDKLLLIDLSDFGDNLFIKTGESITMAQAIGSNENVSRLADAVLPLVSKYHIEKVWLFGSRARGTEHESSDFDVCILPSEQFSFSDYYYFEKELSEILNSEVHVMTRGALESEHDQFYNNVVRDEVLVYG